MYLVAYLQEGVSDIEIEALARHAGISLRAISRLYKAAAPKTGLMLEFSGFPPQVIVPAAAQLAALIARGGRSSVHRL